jgi:hypothetical protein
MHVKQLFILISSEIGLGNASGDGGRNINIHDIILYYKTVPSLWLLRLRILSMLLYSVILCYLAHQLMFESI